MAEVKTWLVPEYDSSGTGGEDSARLLPTPPAHRTLQLWEGKGTHYTLSLLYIRQVTLDPYALQ
jgi:hypothetical protein